MIKHIEEQEIEKIMLRFENVINNGVNLYENSNSKKAKAIREIILHVGIFQYELCREILSLYKIESKGFAACVALKNLVLRLHEYDDFANKHLVRKIIDIANALGSKANTEEIKLKQKQWHNEFKKIRSLKSTRNEAAHYRSAVQTQIELLRKLDQEEILDLAEAVIGFNLDLLRMIPSPPENSSQ